MAPCAETRGILVATENEIPCEAVGTMMQGDTVAIGTGTRIERQIEDENVAVGTAVNAKEIETMIGLGESHHQANSAVMGSPHLRRHCGEAVVERYRQDQISPCPPTYHQRLLRLTHHRLTMIVEQDDVGTNPKPSEVMIEIIAQEIKGCLAKGVQAQL